MTRPPLRAPELDAARWVGGTLNRAVATVVNNRIDRIERDGAVRPHPPAEVNATARRPGDSPPTR